MLSVNFFLIGVLSVSSVLSGFAYAGQQMIRVDVQFVTASASSDSMGRNTARSSNSSQFLILSEGMRAELTVAERIAAPPVFYEYLSAYGVETVQSQYRDIGTAFEVYAKMSNEFIELTLTPVIRMLTGTEGERVHLMHLSTTVRLLPGQEILLGAGQTNDEFYRHFYKANTQSQYQIKVKASLLNH